jgi:hypothetical protein
MLISIVTEANQIDPGSLILEECFYNQEQKGPYLLASGEENPQGEEVLIIGTKYIVNRKEYDLASGYAIKAAEGIRRYKRCILCCNNAWTH